MKNVLLLLTLLTTINSFGQLGNRKSIQSNLHAISFRLEQIVSDDWFIEVTDSSVLLTYCKTCQTEYENHIDSIRHEFHVKRDSSINVWVSSSRPNRIGEFREDYLTHYGPDSIAYGGTICFPIGGLSTSEAKQWYDADDVLTIEIKLEKKWKDRKIERVQERNDTLTKKIHETPLYKSTDRFDDYRAFLPQEFWSKRTEEYDYYYERLPYNSEKYDYSIFLISNKEHLTSEAVLVDRNDPLYFEKEKNFIEKERQQTMIIIAYTLGLVDFEYFGQ